jgi:hypothetical protein
MKGYTKTTFIDDCINGYAAYGDLDDYIHYWHDNDTGNALHEYLGFADSEYERWAETNDDEFIQGVIKDRISHSILKTNCINGDLRVGDLVLSTPEDDYSCLVGRVTDIKLLGDPNRDTENETDDVYIDFTAFEYSPERVTEIEEMFSDLYDEPKSFDDAPLDMVIMAPMNLIRITGIDEEKINAFLRKGMYAAEYCYNTLRKHSIISLPLSAEAAKIRIPYASVWDGGSVITTTANLNARTGEITDIEVLDADVVNNLEICEREYVIIDDCEIDVIVKDEDDTRWIPLLNDLTVGERN